VEIHKRKDIEIINHPPQEIENQQIELSKKRVSSKFLQIEIPIDNKTFKRCSPHHDFHYGFFYFFKSTVFKCRSINKNEIEIYKKLSSYISERTDIKYYLKHIEKSDKFRTLFLNYYQNLCFKYLKRADINSPEEIDLPLIDMERNQNTDYTKLIQYFKHMQTSDGMTELDRALLQLIDPEIKVLSSQK
jgi:hypothetical protein